MHGKAGFFGPKGVVPQATPSDIAARGAVDGWSGALGL
jgi:hypothetical protein